MRIRLGALVMASFVGGCGSNPEISQSPIVAPGINAARKNQPRAPRLNDPALHNQAAVAYVSRWNSYGCGVEPKRVLLFKMPEPEQIGYHLWTECGNHDVHLWGTFSSGDAKDDQEPHTLGEFPQWSQNSRLPEVAKGPNVRHQKAEEALMAHFKRQYGWDPARLKLIKAEASDQIKFAAWVDIENYGILFYGNYQKSTGRIDELGKLSGDTL